MEGKGTVGIVCRFAFCSATCRAMLGNALAAAASPKTATKVVFIAECGGEEGEKWGKAFFPRTTLTIFSPCPAEFEFLAVCEPFSRSH